MLGLDALAKRACLAVIAGFLASLVLPDKWSVFVAVVVLYVLLIVHSRPVSVWPLE